MFLIIVSDPKKIAASNRPNHHYLTYSKRYTMNLIIEVISGGGVLYGRRIIIARATRCQIHYRLAG